MTQEELELLSKEELIRLILAQAKMLEQLKCDYEELKRRFDEQQKPPTRSKNSSQPPSKDQKSNQGKSRRHHKHGPQIGHDKHERALVAHADQIVDLHSQRCRECLTDLRAEEGQMVKVNQITELPPAKAQVIEVRQYMTVCPQCGEVQVEEPAIWGTAGSDGSLLPARTAYEL